MNNLKYIFESDVEECVCGTQLMDEYLYICETFSDGKSSNILYTNSFNGSIKQENHIEYIA